MRPSTYVGCSIDFLRLQRQKLLSSASRQGQLLDGFGAGSDCTSGMRLYQQTRTADGPPNALEKAGIQAHCLEYA